LDRSKTPDKSGSETAPAPKSRLGRGLSALIPATSTPIDVPEPFIGEVPQELPISSIVPNSFQPRTEFEPASLEELTQSILTHGVLQPILVRPVVPGRYELIAGERRFRASEAAGLRTIPAIVRDMTDEESLTVALIENIQREDLNAIEAARGYRQLIEQFGLTQSNLAKQIGKAQPTIANALRLLKLAPEIQESISAGQITEEHGKALLSIADEEQRLFVWRMVVQRQLSVAETRRLAFEASSASPSESTPKRGPVQKDVHWNALEDRLRSAFGMKIGLRPSSTGGGTLTIQFSDPEEIEGILERLQ
jgi:ParB family chromosome partitioning protein